MPGFRSAPLALVQRRKRGVKSASAAMFCADYHMALLMQALACGQFHRSIKRMRGCDPWDCCLQGRRAQTMREHIATHPPSCLSRLTRWRGTQRQLVRQFSRGRSQIVKK